MGGVGQDRDHRGLWSNGAPPPIPDSENNLNVMPIF